MAKSRNFANNVSVGVEFEKLSYHIPVRESDFKSVLKSLNGSFPGEQFNVIMGQSGSGKSSLLNILAGYITENVSGEIYLNGKPRDKKWFNKISTYIMQDDVLQPHLTYRESMMFSANFKLGSAVTQEEKCAIVDEITDTLRMNSCLDLMPNQMSGGEKKRCSIALELVSDPPVIFLDEPTSGLDNVSAKQCLELLKSLTLKGKTVICSIHQPSDSDILLFDHIFLLHDGNCIYTGTVKNMVPHLRSLNFNCPITHNPIDFLIEIASSDVKNVETLVENTKVLNLVERQDDVHISRRLTLSEIFARNVTTNDNYETFPTTRLEQMLYLTRRHLLQICRNRLNLVIQILCYSMVGLLSGLMFAGTGNRGESLHRTFILCVILVVFMLVINWVELSLIYPMEVKILKREHFNRWYRMSSYYITYYLISIPFCIVLCNLVTSFTYVLSSQPIEFWRYVQVVTPLIILRMASQALGMMIGSIFNMKNGAIISPTLASLFIITSIHGMGYGPNIAPLVKLIMSWNFARSAIESLMLALMADRHDITCEDVYCRFQNPQTLLRDMGVINKTYTIEVLKIVGFFIVFKILAFLVLKFRLTNKYCEKIKIFKNKYQR